jgi:hypothetical protein
VVRMPSPVRIAGAFVAPVRRGDGYRFFDSAGAERGDIVHDGSNVLLRFSKGSFTIQTDEGTDTNTEVRVKGKGTGFGRLKLFDEGATEWLDAYMSGGAGFLGTAGSAPGDLNVQPNAGGGVALFGAASSGQNRFFSFSGWNTGAAARRYGRMRIDSNGDLEVEAQSGQDVVVKTGGVERVRVRTDGAVILSPLGSLPSAVAGGLVVQGNKLWFSEGA